MPRLIDKDLKDGIIAAIRAGKTIGIINCETGVPCSTIRWIAARNGLRIVSRYNRVIPGSYWDRYRFVAN